jgi:predicted ester cyclase
VSSAATPGDERERLARAWLEIVDAGDLERLAALCDERLTVHAVTPVRAALPPGLARVGAVLAAWRALLPDGRFAVDGVESEADVTACRFITTGTCAPGVFPGGDGQRVAIPGRLRFRFDGGRVVEHWIEIDPFELVSRLGLVLPGPGESHPRPAAEGRAIAGRWVAAFTSGEVADLSSLCDPAVSVRVADRPAALGVDALSGAVAEMHAALADVAWEDRGLVMQGSTVTCRGALTGLPRGAAGAERARFRVVFVLRLAAGRLSALWASVRPAQAG